MKKSTIFIIFLLVIGFIGGGILLTKKKEEEKNINYDNYDLYSIIEGNEDNGGISDHVKGTVEGVEPELYILEYAEFQCPGCGTTNPWVNELLESYNGKVAVIYRTFLIKDHKNAKAAASAAEAAGLQGYWKEYANLLFANQSEWGVLSGSGRKEKFIEYFNSKTVANGKGDEQKFAEDMASKEVKAKIEFDVAVANKIGVSATPSFFIDGKEVDWIEKDATTKTKFIEYFKQIIDKKLEEKK